MDASALRERILRYGNLAVSLVGDLVRMSRGDSGQLQLIVIIWYKKHLYVPTVSEPIAIYMRKTCITLIVINCFQFCVVLELFCFNLKWDLHYNYLKCIKYFVLIILEQGYYR